MPRSSDSIPHLRLVKESKPPYRPTRRVSTANRRRLEEITLDCITAAGEAHTATTGAERIIGLLLSEVAKGRLYRSDGHKSFDSYVRTQLGFAKTRAYDLIEKAHEQDANFPRKRTAGRRSDLPLSPEKNHLSRAKLNALRGNIDAVVTFLRCTEDDSLADLTDALVDLHQRLSEDE